VPDRLLLGVAANLFFYWLDDVGTFFPKSLEVEAPDELPKRHLPRFLVMIVQLAEFLGIHSQFPGHLDFGMGQTVPLPRIYPCLHSVIGFSWTFHHFMHSVLKIVPVEYPR